MPPRFLLPVIASLLCTLPLAAAPLLPSGQNLPILGDTERESLSPLLERKVGEQIMRDLRRDSDYLDDAPLLDYLNNFGSALLASTPDARGEANYDYFFFAVRDPMLNAFALPGGFIAVHSGLMLAAQNESELASVMSHEIGHVSQRHIARMLGKQKQDALIPLAAILLAVLAARSSPDAASAMMMGGQGLAIQRQLNFSRDAEREADRVGLQILRDANFDTTGMIAFFRRLQSAGRSYGDNVPAFLRSHPLTSERIADITARTQDYPYKQRADSLDFNLIRARVRVLQDTSSNGMRDAAAFFETQLRQKSAMQVASGKYGLATIALRESSYPKALALLQESRAALPPSTVLQSPLFANLSIEIRLAAGQHALAIRDADVARGHFPLSRSIARQYAQALLAAGRNEDAVFYLRDQASLYRQETQLLDLLAQAYAAQGRLALQHLALAEVHALGGTLPAALEQLTIARNAPDASFYDQAMIDARERELQSLWREEMKERGRQ
jgi:predicted Zn-dependent protease